MTLQISTDAQNTRLDSMIGAIVTPANLLIYDGTVPSNCVSSDTNNILVTIALPIPFMLSASSGSISKTGTWEDVSADLSGTAGHFRILDVSEICQMQGTVSLFGDGGDLILDSLDITAGQDVVINAFTIVDGNS